MSTLTRDDVRQRLRILLYQEQQPVNRLAKDCGMDAKTITLASNGEMTNRTLFKFTRWLSAKDKGIEKPFIRENKTILYTVGSKSDLIGHIGRMFKEQRENSGYHGKSRASMETMTFDELKLLFYKTESRLKAQLLKTYENLIDKYHIWLYDKWDYWQWKEKIEVTLKDTVK